MKVCVIGLGYIGLPTAAILARNGHVVTGTDIDETLLDDIRQRGAPAEEPGLAELVMGVIDDGTLTLSTTAKEAETFILCLPTPIKNDKTADMSFVESGMDAILTVLKKGDMVILESTVPPGTTAGIVASKVESIGLDPLDDVDLAFAPERVIPGNILHELRSLDRVMGGLTEKAAERAKGLYSSFVTGDILLTDATTAEFVKLVENSYRDVNIAFANELATLAHNLDVDVWEAIGIANRHPRVNIHRPGPGVGGHCIAVDPYFIIEKANGMAKMLSSAREVNADMPARVVARIRNIVGELSGKTIAVLGLAYKGNVGDTRESPALDIITLLQKEGVVCKVHDPYVTRSPIELSGLEESVANADLVLVATDHKVFRDIDPSTLGSLVRTKTIFDTRNILDKQKWEEAGWSFSVL